MRLKVFTAASIAQAMDMVRDALGEDAVILNVDRTGRSGPVRITAAAEQRSPAPDFLPGLPIEAAGAAHPQRARSTQTEPVAFSAEQLNAVLRYHALPQQIAVQIVQEATSRADDGQLAAVAGALDAVLSFRPFADPVGEQAETLLLAGTPGQGKTLAVARLAAQARMNDRPVQVITMDGEAAGALEQLQRFCQPLDIPVQAISDPAQLDGLAARNRSAGKSAGLTVIDTAGLNPYSLDDINLIARTIKRSGAEPLWVMAAGVDGLEAAEMADVFGSLGARRMLVTRLDATRRLGALLTAPMKSRISLAGFSLSPYLSDMIAPATPLALASQLLGKPDPAQIARTTARARAAAGPPASAAPVPESMPTMTRMTAGDYAQLLQRKRALS